VRRPGERLVEVMVEMTVVVVTEMFAV